MSIGAINPEDHTWICTIGTPIIGKVKGKVIKKISLTFGDNVYMTPNEVKRIEVQDIPENLVLKSTWYGHLSIIVTPQEKNMVEIRNNSLLPATIFPNLPIVEAETKIHKVNAEMEVEKKSSENFWPNENIDEDRLEAILEPGLEIMEPKIMSKELEHIKTMLKYLRNLNHSFEVFGNST
jgi:hypothetical protein